MTGRNPWPPPKKGKTMNTTPDFDNMTPEETVEYLENLRDRVEEVCRADRQSWFLDIRFLLAMMGLCGLVIGAEHGVVQGAIRLGAAFVTGMLIGEVILYFQRRRKS
jgi:predicted DNA-binding protein (UPF0278 family)